MKKKLEKKYQKVFYFHIKGYLYYMNEALKNGTMKNTNRITVEYATIGGRIEDYKATASSKGLRAAKAEIKETYGEETEVVYNGLKVYMQYGFDTYYTGIIQE